MPDWLKDMWTSILDIWLPSKWPRLVATTAMGLEIGILTLSTWGPKFGLTPTESQMSIIRTEGSPWLFFFSLALIHYLVVRDKNASTILQPWKFHEKITLSMERLSRTNNLDKFSGLVVSEVWIILCAVTKFESAWLAVPIVVGKVGQCEFAFAGVPDTLDLLAQINHCAVSICVLPSTPCPAAGLFTLKSLPTRGSKSTPAS